VFGAVSIDQQQPQIVTSILMQFTGEPGATFIGIAVMCIQLLRGAPTAARMVASRPAPVAIAGNPTATISKLLGAPDHCGVAGFIQRSQVGVMATGGQRGARAPGGGAGLVVTGIQAGTGGGRYSHHRCCNTQQHSTCGPSPSSGFAGGRTRRTARSCGGYWCPGSGPAV
jgi:hypothetical protein